MLPAAGAAAEDGAVIREPYLQLGNAPLVGYPGAGGDQVEVIWQSLGMPRDPFTFEYRHAESTAWTELPAIIAVAVGDGRVNHSVVVRDLDFDELYRYRVRYGASSYEAEFRTRLPPGSPTPFRFAAYGDSAEASSIAAFNQVQSAINNSGSAFALLLGDNAYPSGTHADYDLRFRRDTAPAAVAWNASHVDYAATGNHDVDFDGGIGFRAAYANPVQVAGVNAPASAPPSFPPEHNYSFDYGMAHFTVVDSNEKSLTSQVLAWMRADLAASHNRWKIVALHHPVTGAPDRIAEIREYYRDLVPLLVEEEVDLLLVGHSHSYGWTYPLTGYSGSTPTFVADTDREYEQGAGVVQVISGAGGEGIVGVSSPGWPHPVVAAGFAEHTSPPAVPGFARVDVSKQGLQVTYVGADGRPIDSFTIAAEPEPEISADLGLADPASGQWVLRSGDGGLEYFYYGNPGDTPLYGDWDCDGVSTVGMYRRSNGFVYLKNDNSTGPADIDFFFGMDGDVPIAGDWNGDGCDTISIYRQTEGRVFISNVLSTTTAEMSYYFGNPADRPFAGDWDGDGIDNVGLHRAQTGFAYLSDQHATAPAFVEFFYGAAFDSIIVADWDGDGKDSVGIYRPSDDRFFLSNTNSQGLADVELRSFGTGLPVAD